MQLSVIFRVVRVHANRSLQPCVNEWRGGGGDCRALCNARAGARASGGARRVPGRRRWPRGLDIIPRMRRPVLVLVLLLVVLRGWFGGAVAMPAPVTAAPHCAEHASVPAGAAPLRGGGDATDAGPGAPPSAPHAAHGPMPPPASHGLHGGVPDAQAAAHGDCGSASAAHTGHGDCGDCQVCHSAVPAWNASVRPPAAAPGAVYARGAADFASADRAPDLRPPILRPSRP